MGIYRIFLPIFMYISTYFHVYFYIFSCIFLLISTYFYIFSAIFMYISTYFHVYFYLFLHIYHISVVFYYSLTQKCGLEMCQKNWHKQTMCPKCQIPGANLAHNIVLPKMANILTFYHKSVVFLVGLIVSLISAC